MVAADKKRIKACLDKTESMTAAEKYVYNPLAYLFMRVLVHTRITPNQLTAFWGVLMVVFSLGLFMCDYRLNIICGIGWVLAYALDCTDGPLSRYTGLTSPRGDYIDSINHRSTYPLLMFFIGYSAYACGRTEFFGISFDPVIYLILGVVAGTCMVVIIDIGTSYNRVCPEKAIDMNKQGSASIEGRNVRNRERFIRLMRFSPTAFENMLVLLPVFAALNAFDLFIIFYGIVYLAGAFVRNLIVLKMIPGIKKV